MSKSEKDDKRTILVLRWVGYSLLGLAVLDVIEIFVPTQLMNPAWVLQMIGSIVESAAVPLVGVMLVLYGEKAFRRSLEVNFLKILSWLFLLVGILYLLLIPLNISNTWQLNQITQNQIQKQANQQLAQLNKVEEELTQATSEDMTNLLASLNPNASVENAQPQQIKEQLMSQVVQGKRQISTQVEINQRNNLRSLLKNSIKWGVGSIIAGVIFLRLWGLSHWVRMIR